MSAFGSAISKYYVHYYAQSYTAHTEPNFHHFNIADYAREKIALRGVRPSQFSQKNKEEYLNFLNALMGRGSNKTSVDIDKIYKQAEKIILEKYKNDLLTIDRISGQVQKLSENKTGSTYQYKTNMIAMSLPHANDFVAKFKQVLDTLKNKIDPNNLSKSLEDYKKDIKIMEELAKDIDKAFSEKEAKTYEAFRDENGKMSKAVTKELQSFYNLTQVKAFKDMQWLLLDGKRKEFITKFNEILASYNLAYLPTNLIQGTHFENLVALAGEMVMGKSLETISQTVRDSLNQHVIGGTTMSATFELDGLSQNLINKIQSKAAKTTQFKTDENGIVKTMIIPKYSQGKIDVLIENNNNYKVKLAESLRISAKSVNSLGHIGAVKQSPMWAMLNQENPGFIKKFLNVFAKRKQNFTYSGIYNITKDSNEKQYNYLNAAEKSARRQIDNIRKESFNAFQLIVAYNALTGDMLQRSSANIFLINDTTTQKLYLIDMADLFSLILNDFAQGSSSINQYFNIQGFDIESRFDNDWTDEGPEERVWNILNQLRTRKLEIIFKGSQQKLYKANSMSIDASGNIHYSST